MTFAIWICLAVSPHSNRIFEARGEDIIFTMNAAIDACEIETHRSWIRSQLRRRKKAANGT